jgi:hypothetical protein
MWCCSNSAKYLLDSIIGGGGDTVTVANDGATSSNSQASGGISLDQGYIGNDVVVVKNGLRICGMCVKL